MVPEMNRVKAVFTLATRHVSTNKQMKKTTQLKKLLTSPELSFIMESHSGLSAKIVEETGFQGIWASGLSISAQLGVRDCNEVSWTQMLEMFEYMSDATQIPILVDADTGYGNFNNARRLVKKLEERGIAGVCMEDKLFPKANSLLINGRQALADVDEFALKIKACKDTQTDPDFCVVARVEAFIADWDVNEALKRAEAYRKAGADAVLIHSKRKDASEIESFMKLWKNQVGVTETRFYTFQGPVVIVPTNYYSVPTDVYRNLGISLIIWANHNLRASINAIKDTSAEIFKKQSLIDIEKKVAPVKEIFRLQREDELQSAEKKYFPQARP
uniref:phosphoenolpyruvate mutase n=1 Tax=Strigamia maritima TaxID=126957 RepID=T1J6D2_STRMM